MLQLRERTWPPSRDYGGFVHKPFRRHPNPFWDAYLADLETELPVEGWLPGSGWTYADATSPQPSRGELMRFVKEHAIGLVVGIVLYELYYRKGRG